MTHRRILLGCLLLAGACATPPAPAPASDGAAWLAGDHHVHSEFSVRWEKDPNNPEAPPKPVIAGDARYAITVNAMMAERNGLAWMVSTDHGGPNHSKLNYELAYPAVQAAREAAPNLVLFYGMELDTPGADHSSLIIPKTPAERDELREIESRFAKHDAWPDDKSRDTEPKMLEALAFMRAQPAPPVVIANHPSRSAVTLGGYGLDEPAELRGWNDAAPNVAIGMEGAPGHQASALKPDGSPDAEGARGGYGRASTMGGFDPMTARLGGFWDSMLGEGRRWWITSTSDSHRHYTEGGSDFWPGEYSKTYVKAKRSHSDVMEALRKGRIFVTTGDLVSEADVDLSAGAVRAGIGGELQVGKGRTVEVTIRVRDPSTPNAGKRTPEVKRIDLIVGDVTGPNPDRKADANPSTRVVKRFYPADFKREGEIITARFTLKADRNAYVRVRGTGGDELEPSPDPKGEDPWSDLWFYTNPVFISVR